jgi:hypothetical protein
VRRITDREWLVLGKLIRPVTLARLRRVEALGDAESWRRIMAEELRYQEARAHYVAGEVEDTMR